MVYAEVIGIQSQNVSGCVKHYVFNNEESDRSGMSANVGNRAAKELYYKPFAAAVDASNADQIRHTPPPPTDPTKPAKP